MGHILHHILGMRKLSAQLVPRLLTPDYKRNRETTSEQSTVFRLLNFSSKKLEHR